MTITRIEVGERTKLRRISMDRPSITLSQVVLRFVAGAKGDKGDKGDQGVPGVPGDPGDGTIDGVPVDLTGIQAQDFLQFDPDSGKIVNAPISLLTGGAF